MSTYEPGTVAVATVRGVKGVRVMRTTGTRGGDDIWLSDAHIDGWRSHTHADVTDVRPLVVLDLDGHDVLPRMADIREAVDEYGTRLGPGTARDLFEAIADQIEAQTKPPRIPEPGWGEKVIAHTSDTALRRLFVNAYTGCEVGTTWIDRDGYHAAWTDLIDPEAVQS